MAVKLEQGTKRFIGLSSDAKPGTPGDTSGTWALADIPAGSSLLESDTGRIYRFDGESWRLGREDDPVMDQVLKLGTEILRELVRQRLMKELETGRVSDVDIDTELIDVL